MTVPRGQYHITVLLGCLILGVAPAVRGQQGPVLQAGLPVGAHAVGFRHEWIIDPTRVWPLSERLDSTNGSVARHMRVDVWYPAMATPECTHPRLANFVKPDPPSAEFEESNRWVERWDSQSYEGYARSADRPLETFMAVRTLACRDAQPAEGRFPLVLYSGGWYNRSPDNAALAEYLAGHGYVVAEVPLLGDGLWTGNLASSPSAIETQMRDVETALGALIDKPWVDRRRVAVMGFSSGGIVALLLEGRNPIIDAVVGLDPSYGGDVDKVFGSPYFDMERSRRPLLTLRAGNERFTQRDRSVVIDSMHLADRYTADVGRSSHGDFSDDVVLETLLSLDRPGEPRTSAEGLAGYRASALATRLFLDGILRGRAPAFDSLRSVVPDQLRWTVRPGARIPSTSGWVDRIGQEGADAAAAAAGRLRDANPGVTVVRQSEINREGYRLIGADRGREAVAVMRFNVLMFPSSANPFDSLADACVAADDRACAIRAYRGLLRVMPSDASLPKEVGDRMADQARRKLKEWGATPESPPGT